MYLLRKSAKGKRNRRGQPGSYFKNAPKRFIEKDV